MISKARREFLGISMSVLLVFFAILFGILYLVMLNDNNQIISDTLSRTEIVYEKTGEVLKDSLVVKFIQYNQTDGSYEAIKLYDSNFFSDEQINTIIKTALLHNYEYGNVGNVYYKLVRSEDLTLIASDMTMLLTSFKGNLLSALLIISIAIGLVFIVIFATSSKFINPLKDTLNRQLQFISNASHELKTPVAIISANADVLKNIDDNKWVNNIKSQTQRMEILITDMLTLAKIDEEKITLVKEKFNLSDTVVACTLPFDALAFEKGLTLEVNIPNNVKYEGDSGSVKKILSILLDNSIKYTSNNGKIIVSLKTEPKLTLTVFNTGSEIPDNEATKIFERFYRGDNSRARSTGGSGLGLAIAKSIAEANRWKISAKSIYGNSMSITIHM